MDYLDTYVKNYITDLNDMIEKTYTSGLHPARAKEIRIIVSECMDRFTTDFCIQSDQCYIEEDETYPEMVEGMKWQR